MIGKLNLKQQFDIEDLKKINLRLNGFTVGEIKQILREAFSCFRTDLSAHHLDQMLKKYRPA